MAAGTNISDMMVAATARLKRDLFLSAETSLRVDAYSYSSSVTRSASYPASSTAYRISAMPVTSGRYSTVARSVARFTLADVIPSTSLRAFSRWATHEAQVIPPMGRVIRSLVSTVIVYFRSDRELPVARAGQTCS